MGGRGRLGRAVVGKQQPLQLREPRHRAPKPVPPGPPTQRQQRATSRAAIERQQGQQPPAAG